MNTHYDTNRNLKAASRETGDSTRAVFSKTRIAVVGNFNRPDSGTIYQAEVLLQNFIKEGATAIAITYQQNRYLRPLSTLCELVRNSHRYQVICCQAFSFRNWINSAVTVLIAELLGKPIAMVYRGGGFREFAEKWPGLVLPFLRRVDKLIAPSEFLALEFQKYGLQAIVIPNVIESDDWPYRRRASLQPKLLWVRHLRPGYNPWMALEVLKQVKEEFPCASLSMVGDGGMEKALRDRSAVEGFSGINFLGHLPMAELKQHYAECDIFISTTNYDNQPRSVLEAMASGLPIVSTNVGGMSFLIKNGVTGILVSANNPQEMARSVIGLLRDPSRGLALADNASKLVQSFSWKYSRHKWAQIFEDLAST